eukprot:699962-Alexandrium_andersonii.AAC.1
MILHGEAFVHRASPFARQGNDCLRLALLPVEEHSVLTKRITHRARLPGESRKQTAGASNTQEESGVIN